MRISSIILLSLLLATLSCKQPSQNLFTRKFYYCCDSSCFDVAHLLRQEVIVNNQLVSYIEYDPEGNPQLYVQLAYEGETLTSRTDSSSFNHEQTNYSFDSNKKLKSKVVYRSRKMVFNEIIDTIPHTEWKIATDTILYWYVNKGDKLEEWEVTNEDSTLLQISLIDNKGRASETSWDGVKEKYFYTPFDSLERTERWSFTAGSSNTSEHQASDLKWRLISLVNYHYDSLNRIIKKETIDGQIEEVIEEESFSYDSQGRLVAITTDNSCVRIVY